MTNKKQYTNYFINVNELNTAIKSQYFHLSKKGNPNYKLSKKQILNIKP